MNREIKFRAWDGTSMRGIDKNDWFSIRSDGFLSISIPSDFEPVLMQYTGLKDKNSTEIYEGDIVKWDDMSDGKYWRVATVHISPDLYFKCFDCPAINNSTAHGHAFHYGNFIYTDTHNHLEVIGNIYQHPELLGGS